MTKIDLNRWYKSQQSLTPLSDLNLFHSQYTSLKYTHFRNSQTHYQPAIMPHHPSEENAPDNLTDKIAQHSRDSNASDHPLHDENKGPIEGVKTSTEAIQGSAGPQIAESEYSMRRN